MLKLVLANLFLKLLPMLKRLLIMGMPTKPMDPFTLTQDDLMDIVVITMPNYNLHLRVIPLLLKMVKVPWALNCKVKEIPAILLYGSHPNQVNLYGIHPGVKVAQGGISNVP